MISARFAVPCWCVLGVVLAAVPAAAPPAAGVVLFTSGQSMPVAGHESVGGAIVLRLHDGGEVVTSPSLIERIEPDPTRPAQWIALAPDVPTLPAKPYADLVEQASERHGVDPRLVYALIEVESHYRANAESPKGALGLMQLMPSTIRRYAVGDPFDPASNIEAGTQHLRMLLDEFGTTGALAAYNAGEGPVRRFDGIPPYPETRKYVSRVLEIVGDRPAVR